LRASTSISGLVVVFMRGPPMISCSGPSPSRRRRSRRRGHSVCQKTFALGLLEPVACTTHHEQPQAAAVLQQAFIAQRLQGSVDGQRVEQMARGQCPHRRHGLALRRFAIQQLGGQQVGQLLVDGLFLIPGLHGAASGVLLK
jgi:hypothetical protein